MRTYSEFQQNSIQINGTRKRALLKTEFMYV